MSGQKIVAVGAPAVGASGGVLLPLLVAGATIYGLAKLVGRLREQNRLSFPDNDLDRRIRRARQEAVRGVRDRLDPMEKRLRLQEQRAKGFSSELGAFERDARKRLEKRDRELREQLEQQRGEFSTLLEEQRRRFDALIEGEREERRQAMESLQDRVRSLVEDDAFKRDAARSFVADLSKILEDMELLPHERFAPGRLAAIARRAEDARGSIEAGMPEAALATAQRTYWDAVDLRDFVLRREREFLLLHGMAVQEAALLLEQARANRRHRLDLGEEPGVDIVELETDHWTRGEQSAYEKDARAIATRLREEEAGLSVEQVREVLERIEALKPRADEIVGRAVQNLLASQMRRNMAELVLDALAPQGFEVQGSAYEGDDERGAYFVKLRNVAGSEVVTVVAPVEGEAGASTLAINSYDAGYVDEVTLYQRADEIASTIRRQGLPVSEPERAGSAREEYRDIDKVSEGSGAMERRFVL